MTGGEAPRSGGAGEASVPGAGQQDPSRPWAAWADSEAKAIRAAGRWREPRDFDASGPEGTLAPDGRRVVSFASNDYLGLTNHPSVVAAAHAALDRWGAGSGAARLVVGSRPVHSTLETELADWKHTERAVLFPTGFAANLGAVTTFGGPDAFICCDELNHASLIDGARLARAEVAVYRHCDLDHLSSLLSRRGDRRALVVTDTVFSMDGDLAPLDDLAELGAREGALLLLDEAHAVLGPEPPPDLLSHVGTLRMGTLSKTLGSLGGFVATIGRFADLIVNRARSYIFTTAPAPADSAAALAALHILRSTEGDALVARLRSHVARLRPGHLSPILSVLCGDEESALDASAALLERGLLVPAIRPPTVPSGTSRLRVTVSAAHTAAQVAALSAALADVLPATAARTDLPTAPRPTASRPPAPRDGIQPPTPAAQTTHLDHPPPEMGYNRQPPRPKQPISTTRSRTHSISMWDEAVRLVVVTGTGTEVGKTWFGAATLQAARDLGVRVTARKPVQSFTAGEGPTDADVLAASTGEDPETVCPPHRWLPVAMAPPMAAAALALPPFTIADLAAEIRASLPAFRTAGASPTRPATQLTADTPTSGLRTTAAGHLVLVEGAGGPRSPLSDDGDTVDLAAALDPDAVVLVADAGLGVISAVHLCAEALSGHPLVVALNRFDPLDELHALNCAWLRERVGLDVVTDPASLAARLLTP